MAQAIFVQMFAESGAQARFNRTETLGKHLSFVTSGGRGWAKYYVPKGSRFIRSFDVQMNEIASKDMVFVDPPDNAEARRTQVEVGDVLLTITGSRIGRVATVIPECDGSFVSQHVAILRLRKTIVPSFLSHFLSLPTGGQLQIARMQYGQTKPGLNFDQIRRFEIPVPPLEAQREFVRRVQVVSAIRCQQEASMVSLDSLFASLQHRAFRGEL